MALTQARMIKALTAGTDFEQAYKQTLEDIWQLLQRAERGDASALTQGALEALFWACKNACKQPGNHSAVLQVEREHFRKNAKRNAYMAKRGQRLRREAGVLPRQNLGPTFGQIAQAIADNHPAPEVQLQGTDMGFYSKMMEEELAAQAAGAQTAATRAPVIQQAPARPASPPPEFHDNLTHREALAINKAQLAEEAESEGAGVSLDEEDFCDD